MDHVPGVGDVDLREVGEGAEAFVFVGDVKSYLKELNEMMLNRSRKQTKAAAMARQLTAQSKTRLAAASPMIVLEPQAYCVPPKDVARVSPVAPSATNRQPR